MSKLNFSQISEAFVLGSEQIKDTQEEIAILKRLVSSSVSKSTPSSDERIGPSDQRIGPSDQRIGPSDNVIATVNQKPTEIDLLQVVQHPKFDDFAKKYVLMKYPYLINSSLKDTQFVPQKENFGNKYSTTIYTNITHYLIFFILSIAIYLFLNSILT